jgi:hypothetical protein
MNEDLNKKLKDIETQAQNIKSNIDVLSQAQQAGMTISPQTSISEAQKFLENKKTSSSFDFVGNQIDALNKSLGSGLGVDIQSLVRKISQPSTLPEQAQQAKQSLLAEKQSSIELAKSFMETEQEKALSALGLKTGVGSLVLESLTDIQRKNALSLANLAKQYDTAIANFDLQAAEATRNELMNLLSTMVQLEDIYTKRNIQSFALATQISAQQAEESLNALNSILSGEKAKSIDELPEKTRSVVNNLTSRIDRLSNLPEGTTRMKIERLLSGGGSLENVKVITTNDGGIYMFGTRGGNVVFEQLKSGIPKQSTGDYLQLLDDFINQDINDLIMGGGNF